MAAPFTQARAGRASFALPHPRHTLTGNPVDAAFSLCLGCSTSTCPHPFIPRLSTSVSLPSLRSQSPGFHTAAAGILWVLCSTLHSGSSVYQSPYNGRRAGQPAGCPAVWLAVRVLWPLHWLLSTCKTPVQACPGLTPSALSNLHFHVTAVRPFLTNLFKRGPDPEHC